MRWRAVGPGCIALALAAPAAGAAPLQDAEGLYRAGHYSEARAALEPLAAAQPPSAEAAYYLGMAILKLGGPRSLDQAHEWLGRSIRLAPANPGYLGDYAGTCLLLADRDNSMTLAVEGRDTMLRAIEDDPSDIDAREGLMRFYAKAPWPLGQPDKAVALAVDIARRDPKRAKAAYASLIHAFEVAGRKVRADEARKLAQGLAQAPAK